jgi:Zn-dependent peptidase ImmA (M78 family)
MMRVAEGAGAVVTRFQEPARTVGTFSRGGKRPVIFLNTSGTDAGRARLELAHESGHLVMHAGVAPSLDAEVQAEAFARALLMPRRVFARDFSAPLDWDKLFAARRRWGVPLPAVITRAHELRLLDALQYRRAYKALSAGGWLKTDPGDLAAELPETLVSAVSMLVWRRIVGVDMARELGWRAETLSWITGLTMEAHGLRLHW